MAKKELGEIVNLVKKQIPILEKEKDTDELGRLSHSLANEVMERTVALDRKIMKPTFMPETAEDVEVWLRQENEIQKISQEVSAMRNNLLDVIYTVARRSSAENIRRLNEALKPIEDWLEKCRKHFGL